MQLYNVHTQYGLKHAPKFWSHTVELKYAPKF